MEYKGGFFTRVFFNNQGESVDMDGDGVVSPAEAMDYTAGFVSRQADMEGKPRTPVLQSGDGALPFYSVAK